MKVGALVWKVPKKRCAIMHGVSITLDPHASGTLGVVIERNMKLASLTVYHGNGITSSGFFEDYRSA